VTALPATGAMVSGMMLPAAGGRERVHLDCGADAAEFGVGATWSRTVTVKPVYSVLGTRLVHVNAGPVGPLPAPVRLKALPVAG